VLPVSTVLDGVYGVSGVALSVPSVVSSEGAVPIGGLDFDPAAREAFERSAAAVRRVAEDLRR
jgi:L-lactate dehydrogenase